MAAIQLPSFIDSTDYKVISPIYNIHEKLGEGSYGVVFRGTLKEGGAPYAIKKLRLDGFSEGVPATAIREITLLKELNHPFIVSLQRVLSGRRRVYLVFELLAEDLRATIVRLAKQGHTLPIPLIKRFTKQALTALWYSHNNRIVHRDLKPGNILVTKDGQNVKIADYGLARAFEMELVTYTHEVVTLWYRAPEILLGERHYTPAVDVFSMGCIIAEMMNGKPLFRGESEITQLHRYFEVLGTPNETSWPGVSKLSFSNRFPDWSPRLIEEVVPLLDPLGCDLLDRMLKCNPAQRPTVAECLKHPWLMDTSVE